MQENKTKIKEREKYSCVMLDYKLITQSIVQWNFFLISSSTFFTLVLQ